ncbi:DNA mismatch repair protein MSH4 [Geosmithia morbida]|uniref:DNA mismatch repair protein MSH3 n=1 Tax=Geosmithia morbida TaxID=1094350 RepID=A0A9P4Z407_9HYPO|nr:DNA mismatch repair protein MSH4 [Geosmithia morbida]KAF4127029.1 DNA mismatch repair protein MSH4 [Geosmithia morbida]
MPPSSSSLRRSGPHASSATTSTVMSLSQPLRTGNRPKSSSGRKSRATTASSILGYDDTQDIICAVSEARGVTPSVGVAFINSTLGEVTLSQILDNQSYVRTVHKMHMLSPSSIIFMPAACPPNNPGTLYYLIRQLLPETQLQIFNRAAWSESSGLDYIRHLAFEDDIDPLMVAVQGKYHATSSFSAAMNYIEVTSNITFSPQSLRIHYEPSDNTMMIDISVFQSLEIMRSLGNVKSKNSLFSLLNFTLTPMGARMLRSCLLQPPTQTDSFIVPRHDALEELVINDEMFLAIRKALRPFRDAEKILTKIIIVHNETDLLHVEEKMNQVLMIKSFLEAVPELHTALEPASSALLIKIRDLCHPEIICLALDKIRHVIEADVAYTTSPLGLRNQRTLAVKSGISDMLDVSRQTYKELTEEIHKHIDRLNELYQVESSLKFDNSRKYWLCLRESDLGDTILPDVFINVVQKKNRIECQTLDLVKLNLRLADISNEVCLRSDSVIRNLVEELRQEIPHLFRACESVALADMLCSFSQAATTRDYVRPQMIGTLALKAARHPMLDKAAGRSFVPNDYYSSEQYRFHIVTGCNMSGKSVYIRTVVLLQIMAQIGCFVPAEYASFPVIHNIFARISMDDRIESNLSTFSVEMREMAFILRNIDYRSLAIIDELGRGTSTRDGLAIAISISEALIQSKASVWFATHFIELAKALSDRPGVLNLHLTAKNTTTHDGVPRIKMLYKVVSGIRDEGELYGINLARALGFPQSFIDKAEETATDLSTKRDGGGQDVQGRQQFARRHLVLDLYESLKQARNCGEGATLAQYLERLQREFIVRMEEVDAMTNCG